MVNDKVPNRDVFGHCVVCGKNMIRQEVIGGVSQQILSPDYVTVEYLLNDNSYMRVSMCKQCRENLDGTEYDYVMNKVWRGWQHEVETYSQWSEERKKNYLDKYKKKAIVIRSDDKPSDVVQKEFKKYKERVPHGNNN